VLVVVVAAAAAVRPRHSWIDSVGQFVAIADWEANWV